MSSIKIELSPEVASVLATLLQSPAILNASDVLERLDHGLFHYYEAALEDLADELGCDAPSIEEVMAAHPRVLVQ